MATSLMSAASWIGMGLLALSAAACGGGGNNGDGGTNPGNDVVNPGQDGGTNPGNDGGTNPGNDGSVTVHPPTGTWSSVSSGTTQNLVGVFAAGGNDVFAVAGRAALRYNGSSFASTDSMYALKAVAGSSATEVWIAGLTIPANGSGETGHPVFQRLMGSSWMDMMPSQTTQFSALSVRAGNDVWAVGNGPPAHYNGTGWSEQSAGLPPGELTAVFALGASDVFAVGAQLAHYNGTAWVVGASLGSQYYWGVWGANARDVWAVGSQGVMAHFDGTAWSDYDPAVPGDPDLYAIWGSAANDIWAVGAGGAIVHYDGAHWSPVTSPTTQNLRSISGSAERDVWAVGEQGTVVRYR